MIDMLVQAGLLASNDMIMLSILLIGYIWVDAQHFARITVLLMIGLILNMVCKVTFQIPLNPALGKMGFAFPSSHMQSAVILYGGICQYLRAKWLLVGVLSILSIVAFAELYSGYHTPRDLLGGAVVAWWLLSFPYSTLSYRYTWCIIGAGATLALYYIHLQSGVPSSIWMAYGAGVGMVCSHACLPNDIQLCWWQQCLAALMSIAVFLLLTRFHINSTVLTWLGCGAILPCTCFLVGRYTW